MEPYLSTAGGFRQKEEDGTTHREHGPEVAEVGEELLDGRLLGFDGEVLQHVLVERGHVAVHDDQLLVVLPCLLGEAVQGPPSRRNKRGQHV